MPKKKTNFEKWIDRGKDNIVIMGDFKNEYGERFFLYYFDYPTIKDIVFITGDEFDWDEGYIFDGEAVYKPFNLNSEETSKALHILEINKRI